MRPDFIFNAAQELFKQFLQANFGEIGATSRIEGIPSGPQFESVANSITVSLHSFGIAGVNAEAERKNDHRIRLRALENVSAQLQAVGFSDVAIKEELWGSKVLKSWPVTRHMLTVKIPTMPVSLGNLFKATEQAINSQDIPVENRETMLRNLTNWVVENRFDINTLA